MKRLKKDYKKQERNASAMTIREFIKEGELDKLQTEVEEKVL